MNVEADVILRGDSTGARPGRAHDRVMRVVRGYVRRSLIVSSQNAVTPRNVTLVLPSVTFAAVQIRAGNVEDLERYVH
jgi:hypothetical protein